MTKEDLQMLEELFDKKLDEKLKPIQNEISEIKSEILEIKAEITDMKKDISIMKENIEEIKDSAEEVRVTTNAQSEWIEKNFDYLPYPIELEDELDEEAKHSLEAHREPVRKHREEKVV